MAHKLDISITTVELKVVIKELINGNCPDGFTNLALFHYVHIRLCPGNRYSYTQRRPDVPYYSLAQGKEIYTLPLN